MERSVSRSRSPDRRRARNPRDVTLGHVAAAGGAEQSSLAEERPAVDRDRRACRQQPTITQRPPAQVDGEYLRDQFGAAHHLERHVDPTGHHAVNGIDERLVPGRERVGGAEVFHENNCLGFASTATIVVAPAIRRALHHVEPHTATADHRHRFARLHVGDVEHRPEARRHTTPGQADHLEREPGIHLHHLFGPQHSTLGEAPDPHHGIHRCAAEAQTGAPIGHPAHGSRRRAPPRRTARTGRPGTERALVARAVSASTT